MSHLLYLMFRFDFDMMENLEKFGGSEHSQNEKKTKTCSILLNVCIISFWAVCFAGNITDPRPTAARTSACPLQHLFLTRCV